MLPLNLSAQINWEETTPPACSDGSSPSVEFEGPKEEIFCASQFNEPIRSNCQGCCFKVVYYDRWHQMTPPGGGFDSYEYDLFIAGVFWIGDNCENCATKEQLAGEIYRLLLIKESENNPDFFEKLYSYSAPMPPAPFEADRTLWFFTPAKCQNSSGGNCAPTTEFCCRTNYYIEFTKNRLTYFETLSNRTFDDQLCNSPCAITCFDFPYSKYEDIAGNMCDPPCDFGIWESEVSEEINMMNFNCPQCRIKIHYSYRETPPCPTYPFIDFRLDYIEFLNCNGCIEGAWDMYGRYQQTEYMFKFAQEWILTKAPGKGLQVGQTSTYFRTIHSSCWRYYPPTGSNPNYLLKPCLISVCCWQKIRITKIAEHEDVYELLEPASEPVIGCPYNFDLLWQLPPCVKVCDWPEVVIPEGFFIQ